MGHSGGGMGLGLQRGVRAERRGELHDSSGEDEEDSGHHRGADSQCLHVQGGRKDGAVRRQHQLQEKEGGGL